jgi:large subunit ribosomal protein L9
MKVILRADITNVGRQGDIKEVAPGFARNFLLPRRLAMEATAANLKVWDREKVKLEKQRDATIASSKELAGKIEKLSLTFTMKVGDSGRLFGSVTNTNIAKLLEENGVTVGRHDILLPEPLKEVGVFDVDIRLHPEVIAKARVEIVAEKSAMHEEVQEEAAEEPKEEVKEEPKEEKKEE